MNFSLVVVGVFSGKSETERGKNEILFYFCGFRGAAFILFRGGGGGLHWVQVVSALWRAHWCRLSRVLDLRSACVGPLVVCSVAFVRSLALLSVRCLRIWLYFAF